MLLVRGPAGGWSSAVFGRVQDHHTRPDRRDRRGERGRPHVRHLARVERADLREDIADQRRSRFRPASGRRSSRTPTPRSTTSRRRSRMSAPRPDWSSSRRAPHPLLAQLLPAGRRGRSGAADGILQRRAHERAGAANGQLHGHVERGPHAAGRGISTITAQSTRRSRIPAFNYTTPRTRTPPSSRPRNIAGSEQRDQDRDHLGDTPRVQCRRRHPSTPCPAAGPRHSWSTSRTRRAGTRRAGRGISTMTAQSTRRSRIPASTTRRRTRTPPSSRSRTSRARAARRRRSQSPRGAGVARH